jgi:NitT/TauT family transport system ATP-binding protein
MTTTLTQLNGSGARRTGPKIELEGVTLAYQSPKAETLAIADVSFGIAAGEFVSIVGPSGCGKSTCLSLIAGIERPTAGAVRHDGAEVTRAAGHVGFMLQRDHLFDWRDVMGNVLVGAEVLGKDRAAARERAAELLERYGLGGFQHHRPSELSGGMRQRVALIRTLVTDPDVVLLDEPFSALDFQTRLSLADEMATILRDQGKTALLVTHDITEAVAMSDRVLVMTGRPGRVQREHRITYAAGRLRPFEAREQPEFQDYFRMIWKEMESHVNR